VVSTHHGSVTCCCLGNSVIFDSRIHAGHALAFLLSTFHGSHVFVVGLARGGMEVANTVAYDLSLPLDVLVVKKIPSPCNSELAVGAVAPDGISFVYRKLAGRVGADSLYVQAQIDMVNNYIRQKMLLYRKGKKSLTIQDKTVIVVDDGVATGATMQTAIKWCKAKKARTIIAAAPVAHPDGLARISREGVSIVVCQKPSTFEAVGQFYKKFPQLTDDNVIQLLHTSTVL